MKTLKTRPFVAHTQKSWFLALERELYSVCKLELAFFFRELVENFPMPTY